MSYIKVFSFLFILLIFNNLQAQARFKGGFVMGMNAAQIDGDNTAGYRQVGASGGVRALVDLGKRWELLIDILYSQKGGRKSVDNESPFGQVAFSRLNYLEVPVLLNLRDWKALTKDGYSYYRIYASLGLSYNRLFNSTSNDNFSHKAVIDKFRKDDVAYMIGVGYNVNKHWGFNWRYAKSLGYLFDPKRYPDDPIAKNFQPLKEHYISFQTYWIF
jgi:hypothetical protein